MRALLMGLIGLRMVLLVLLLLMMMMIMMMTVDVAALVLMPVLALVL